jgi:hypothetical protein
MSESEDQGPGHDGGRRPPDSTAEDPAGVTHPGPSVPPPPFDHEEPCPCCGARFFAPTNDLEHHPTCPVLAISEQFHEPKEKP